MVDETQRNQKIFRKIMEAFSYPGKILDLECQREYRGDLFAPTIEIALTLLDGEVSLYVGGRNELSQEEIQIRTNVEEKSLDTADYVIFPLDQGPKIKDDLGRLKIGTLINPQLSATAIIEVEGLSNDGPLVLSGPGIKDTSFLNIEGPVDWLKERSTINENFPLGIDIILVDKNGRVVCLPRTTEIKVGE